MFIFLSALSSVSAIFNRQSFHGSWVKVGTLVLRTVSTCLRVRPVLVSSKCLSANYVGGPLHRIESRGRLFVAGDDVTRSVRFRSSNHSPEKARRFHLYPARSGAAAGGEAQRNRPNSIECSKIFCGPALTRMRGNLLPFCKIDNLKIYGRLTCENYVT